MRQENVLCLEYSLLGNVDRGCDFHRIMALQRGAMSIINAMNGASQYTEFLLLFNAGNFFPKLRREPQVFVDGRSCCETAPL